GPHPARGIGRRPCRFSAAVVWAWSSWLPAFGSGGAYVARRTEERAGVDRPGVVSNRRPCRASAASCRPSSPSVSPCAKPARRRAGGRVNVGFCVCVALWVKRFPPSQRAPRLVLGARTGPHLVAAQTPCQP